MKHRKTNIRQLAASYVANVPIGRETHPGNVWKKHVHRLLIIFLLVSGKIISQEVVPQPDTLPRYQSGKLYFQLKLSSNVVIHSRDEVVNDPGDAFLNLFSQFGVTYTERPYEILETPELQKTYMISFNQPENVEDLIGALQNISDVQFAEKVPVVQTHQVPVEISTGTPQSPSLYHLALLNSNLASNIHIAPGNVFWNSSIVAIVDDAVQITHEDLAANVGPWNRDVTLPAPTNVNDPNPPLAGGLAGLYTHGTHVAGIAGAVTNNSNVNGPIGVASIGWNNRLMGVKTATTPGLLHFAYSGVAWAAANGAKVINMSFGGGAYSQVDYNVISAAKNNWGCVLVASAGNNGMNLPIYPAAYGGGTTGQSWEVLDHRLVVAVSALDQNNNMSVWGPGSGSNYGLWVDIAAYGTNIMSTLAASNANGAAINNQYGQLSGTSMSAPMVTGIVGIMRSYTPNKTANQIIDCLLGTANPDIYGPLHPTNPYGLLGKGRADAAAALRCLSSNCAVNPLAIIVPSSQNYCTGTPVTLTANQGVSYLWNTGAVTQAITTTVPGTYQVTVNFGGCTSVASINTTPPTLSISQSVNTSICPGSQVTMLTATGTYNSVVWQPGGMTTPQIAVNPSVFTVYTAVANQYCGGTTATFGVNPNVSPALANAPYSIINSAMGGNYGPTTLPYGYYLVTSNVSLSSPAAFYSSDIAIAPNVQITVPSNTALQFNFSRLRTCGTDMWQGIQVNDGGQLSTDNQSVIEDAIVAISSVHTPLSSQGLSPAIIHLRSTLFNRNRTDVSLTNYYDNLAPASYSNKFTVDNCIFTCRNFGGLWLSAGFSYPNATYAGLRAATVANPGLGTPYGFYTYGPGTLKAPYTGQTSHCAIFLNSTNPTGVVAGNDFVIGDVTGASWFNLFDRHDVFVNSQNCNVTLKNNVFQNQFHATVLPQNVSYNGPWQLNGGWLNNSAAVMHRTFNASLATKLDMTATATNLGNRFFDCVRAVEGHDVAEFKMSNGIVRSTHTANGTNIPGESGLLLKTGRVNYDIHHNEFSNLKTAINIPITAGAVYNLISLPGPVITTVYGNYLTALAIYANQFNAGNTGIGNFMNQAVNVTNNVGVQPNMPSPLPLLTPQLPNYGWVVYPWYPQTFRPTGLGIINNLITGAYNGINVNGFTGFPVWVAQNNVNLIENTGATQFGIRLDNGTSTAQRQQSVWLNDVKCTGNSPANVSLIFAAANSGNTSPIINCNYVKDANKGFVFAGINAVSSNFLGLQWRGNRMENLNNGMRLQGHPTSQPNVFLMGRIGQQGDATVAMGNYWNGTWTLPNYHIWTETSIPSLSPLVHISSPLNTMNFGTNIPGWQYGPATISQISNNNFYCDWTQYFVDPNPNPWEPVEVSDMQKYLDKAQRYHFLRNNSAERNNYAEEGIWYNEVMASSNLEALELTQDNLFRGEYAEARARIATLSPENYVEEKTLEFYNLYANYLQSIYDGTDYPQDDADALAAIAQLCPIEYGTTVFKARGVYNSIFGEVINYDDCQVSTPAPRNGSTAQNAQNETPGEAGLADLDHISSTGLYPNPASNRLIIKSAGVNDEMTIRIFDMTGREVLMKQLKTENYMGVVEFDLANGAYMATITNSHNQVMTKKLVIAK